MQEILIHIRLSQIEKINVFSQVVKGSAKMNFTYKY
jgi:hypothetical protein